MLRLKAKVVDVVVFDHYSQVFVGGSIEDPLCRIESQRINLKYMAQTKVGTLRNGEDKQ